ncbi:MAG: YybH family protein [Bacteroidota bacterium]
MKVSTALFVSALVFLAMSFSFTAQDDRRAITDARNLYNQAIAAKDTAAMGKYCAPDIVVISSRNSEFHGRKHYLLGFARDLEAGRVYLRSPKRIDVFTEWRMAAEEGDWYGQWEDRDGPVNISGTYFAKWHKVDGKWLIRTEIFVPLKCKGGAFCASRPF